jgi:hypothetical protein
MVRVYTSHFVKLPLFAVGRRYRFRYAVNSCLVCIPLANSNSLVLHVYQGLQALGFTNELDYQQELATYNKGLVI